MEATLHSHNLLARYGTKNQTALVTLNGRYGHIRNILILQAVLNIYAIDKATQTCAEDDTHLGLEIVCSLLNCLTSL